MSSRKAFVLSAQSKYTINALKLYLFRYIDGHYYYTCHHTHTHTLTIRNISCQLIFIEIARPPSKTNQLD